MPRIDIDIDEVLGESDSAVCVLIDTDEYWLPLRCCTVDEENKTVRVPESLALEKGMI